MNLFWLFNPHLKIISKGCLQVGFKEKQKLTQSILDWLDQVKFLKICQPTRTNPTKSELSWIGSDTQVDSLLFFLFKTANHNIIKINQSKFKIKKCTWVKKKTFWLHKSKKDSIFIKDVEQKSIITITKYTLQPQDEPYQRWLLNQCAFTS